MQYINDLTGELGKLSNKMTNFDGYNLKTKSHLQTGRFQTEMILQNIY